MKTHTPGPWTIRQDGPAKIPAIESLSGPVAMLYAGESAAADAQLIAAAPELLAALEMIREAASGHVPLVNSWVLSVARAAINKTGA